MRVGDGRINVGPESFLLPRGSPMCPSHIAPLKFQNGMSISEGDELVRTNPEVMGAYVFNTESCFSPVP